MFSVLSIDNEENMAIRRTKDNWSDINGLGGEAINFLYFLECLRDRLLAGYYYWYYWYQGTLKFGLT